MRHLFVAVTLSAALPFAGLPGQFEKIATAAKRRVGVAAQLLESKLVLARFKDATPSRHFESLRDVLRLTRDVRILRSHDLPFPGAFEPCVGPDQTTLCLLAIFSLDRAFRSIRDRDGVAEKSHLYLAELAVARERLGICGDRFRFVV